MRETLARDFAHEKTESPAYGEVAFFRLGNEEGAVHSEPPTHEDRIFVNIVPGSEEELTELMGRWGMKFPRAWSFGVPGGSDLGALRDEQAWEKGMGLETVETPLSYRKWEQEEVGGGDRASLSTMSLNLGAEYAEWLKGKGFQFAQIFGQAVSKKVDKE
jgi:hypothetical protein